MSAGIEVRRREHTEERCPLCKDELASAEQAIETCPGCSVSYHQACLTELGGCGTAGCSAKAIRIKVETRGGTRRPQVRLVPVQRGSRGFGLALFGAAALCMALGFVLSFKPGQGPAIVGMGIGAFVFAAWGMGEFDRARRG